jgi:pyrroline-5-carboxylate reductase
MERNERKIGFIGAGNMAAAICKGMLMSGFVQTGNIFASDIDSERLRIFSNMGADTSKDNGSVVRNSDIVILAIKPDIYKIVLKEISKIPERSSTIFISIAPGISINYIKSVLGDIKIVRAMPNTPATVLEGMTVTAYKKPVTEEEFKVVNSLFKSIGEVESVDEKYMNEVVALNGSSPAYVFMMIEAMADAAVMRGISRDSAYKIAAQSVSGAAKMVLETDTNPAQLKDMVCSPGGTTIQAVHMLEKHGFRNALIEAMEKCTDKAIEIGQKYE